MDITLKNIDAVNAIIKINVVKNDYAETVENSLKKLRQKADFPGFRKGMVPTGVVKKMYGTSVLVEEINKLVSDKLYTYIRENKLNVLGEPLPNETEQKEIDFTATEDYEFCFDIGLAPEIKIELNKKDKLPYYTVKVDEDMLNKQIESYRANYGTYTQVDAFAGKDMLKGTLTELENGSAKPAGLLQENAVMMPFYIKDESEKAKFDQVKKEDIIVFNPYKAYEGNEAELSSFLKVNKEHIGNHNGDFSFEVKEITHYDEAEMNQEFFDKIFPAGEVKTEEDFRERVKNLIASQYLPNSDYKFLVDARALMDKKIGDLQFPDAFLKRWLTASDKNRTIEAVEEDYPKIVEDLRFHLAKEQLIKDNDLKLEEEDLMLHAKKAAQAQFAQYGMMSVPDDVLENYAKDMLKNQETVRNLVDRAMEDKLIQCIQDKVKTEDKELPMDEFVKLFEK